MYKKTLLSFAVLSLLMFSCTAKTTDTIDNNVNGGNETPASIINGEYEYIEYKSGIKLTKYTPIEYSSLITIPNSIDGKKVIAIAKGCFAKKQNRTNKKRADDDGQEIEEDSNSYFIGEDVEEIDDGSFDEGSTFFTPNEDKPEGWDDGAINGSATDGDGNVYFDTNEEDITVSNDVVYSYNSIIDGYYIARCLSKESVITIESKFNDKNVAIIGRDSFSNNNYVEKIIFPNTITNIYPNSFFYCENLKEVTFNSPNLSTISFYAFSGCVSLNIVVLPERCTSISMKAFSDCGEITELYIPSTMTKISKDAFYNTTVKEIYYSGTESMWENLMSVQQVEGLENTIIHYVENTDTVVLDTPSRVFETLQDGTEVVVTGILSAYIDRSIRSTKHLLITDPETGYSIVCYNVKTSIDCDEQMIGRKVLAVGNKSYYYGSVELNNAVCTFLDDETIYSVSPINIDWNNVGENIEQYSYIYTSITGTVSRIDGKRKDLEEYDNVYLFGITPQDLQITVGKKIRVRGLLVRYNQDFEFKYDYTQMEILND